PARCRRPGLRRPSAPFLVVASVLLDDDDLLVVVVAMPIVRMMMSAFLDDDPLAFGLGRRQGHHESNGGKCRQRHSDLAHSSSSPVFSPRENSSRAPPFRGRGF